MCENSDRIERRTLLRVPRARVWQALTTPEEFGRWFGVRVHGPSFAPGQHVRGPVTYPGFEHVFLELWIERVEPPRLLSWEWHPAAIEAGVDYSQEPKTRVVFDLAEAAQGTLLTVVESGFDRLTPERRVTVLRLNTEGWEEQMLNIEKHVAAG
jgi:uncharacterized protein YndB with AHSA1/START domain